MEKGRKKGGREKKRKRGREEGGKTRGKKPEQEDKICLKRRRREKNK